MFGEEMETVQRGVYFGTISPHIEDMLDFFIGSSPKRFNLEVQPPCSRAPASSLCSYLVLTHHPSSL